MSNIFTYNLYEQIIKIPKNITRIEITYVHITKYECVKKLKIITNEKYLILGHHGYKKFDHFYGLSQCIYGNFYVKNIKKIKITDRSGDCLGYSITVMKHLNKKKGVLRNFTHLHIGGDFNFNFKKIPYSVTHLLCNCYKYLNIKIKIPQNITHLYLNGYFNKKIIIPCSVICLTFGNWFNKKIIIPHNIVHLNLGFNFQQKIIIPINVKHLKIFNLTKKTIIPYNTTHVTICKFS